MNRYAALLRGINIGPHKKVDMKQLQKLLEGNGYTNVKTLLNSGNVVFDSENNDAGELKQHLETIIAEHFGFNVPVIIRTKEQLQDLIALDPFKGITVTPATRLYITFLPVKPAADMREPYDSAGGNFAVLQVTDGEVISVLTLTPNSGSPDMMKAVEGKFSKLVTTRNWNTVEKLARLVNQ